MATEARQIQSINDKLAGGYKVAVVSVDDLEFLDKNARFMKNETFQNLVQNIKNDGGITQLPFCMITEEGKYRILSGNHRSSAAIAAGLKEIPVIYTEEQLSKSEQIAIQLSHNSISGEDDPIILSELYAEIEDLEMKYYSGLDDKILEQMDNVSIDGITEAQLDFLQVSFLFLPEEKDDLINAFNKAKDLITNETVLARYADFDRLLTAQEDTQAAFSIHNGATSMMVILDIFNRHIEDLKEGYLDEDGEPTNKNFVPIASVLSSDKIPAQAAAVLNRAVEKAISKKDITKKNKWQLIEYLAAEYLAGD